MGGGWGKVSISGALEQPDKRCRSPLLQLLRSGESPLTSRNFPASSRYQRTCCAFTGRLITSLKAYCRCFSNLFGPRTKANKPFIGLFIIHLSHYANVSLSRSQQRRRAIYCPAREHVCRLEPWALVVELTTDD